MTPSPPPTPGSPGDELKLLALNVGNTRTSFGVFTGDRLEHAASAENRGFDGLLASIIEEARSIENAETRAVVCATVNPAFSDSLIEALEKELDAPVRRVGDDLPVALAHTLGPDHTTGQDRLLAALGAYELLGQACVVIDAGTAITVDFVDGTGVFHGGAIAPGAQLMLDALAERTAALPVLDAAAPDPGEPYGKTTAEAMRAGVYAAGRGLVRVMLDAYAESYGAYPAVVATGGDAELLFADEPLVEHVVPHLVLSGIAVSVHRALGMNDDD